MYIVLSIYILGIIAYLVTLWINYRKLDSGTEISLSQLIFYILMGVMSWFAFISAMIIMYGDTIVLKKK